MSGGQGAWIPQTWTICSPLLNLPPYPSELCFSKCQPGPAAAAAAPECLFEMQIQTYPKSWGVGPTVWLLSLSRYWFWCLLLVKRRCPSHQNRLCASKNNQGATAHISVCSSLVEDQEGHEAQTCSLPWKSVLVAGWVGLAASWWPEHLWASYLVSEKRTGSWVGPKGVQSLSLLASHQLNNLGKLCSLGLLRVKNSDI